MLVLLVSMSTGNATAPATVEEAVESKSEMDKDDPELEEDVMAAEDDADSGSDPTDEETVAPSEEDAEEEAALLAAAEGQDDEPEMDWEGDADLGTAEPTDGEIPQLYEDDFQGHGVSDEDLNELEDEAAAEV